MYPDTRSRKESRAEVMIDSDLDWWFRVVGKGIRGDSQGFGI